MGNDTELREKVQTRSLEERNQPDSGDKRKSSGRYVDGWVGGLRWGVTWTARVTVFKRLSVSLLLQNRGAEGPAGHGKEGWRTPGAGRMKGSSEDSKHH